jgi:hypothetical protein
MKLNSLALLPLLALSVALPACAAENPDCAKLAEHVTDVLSKEKAGIPDEAKTKAIKDMTASCNKDVPDKAIIDCAMAAQTRDDLVKCDPEKKAE